MKIHRTQPIALAALLALAVGCSGSEPPAAEPAAGADPTSGAAPQPTAATIPHRPPAAPPLPRPAVPPKPREFPIDPEVREIVYRYIEMFYAGDLDALHGFFSAEMQEGMDREKLQQFHDTVQEQFGPQVEVVAEETAEKDIYRAFVRWARHEKSDELIEFHWRLRPDDSIAGLWMNPAKKKIRIVENP